MQRTDRNIRFWGILGMINVAVMAYPVGQYLQADSNNLLFASAVMIGTGFLVAFTDAVSAIVAFLK